MMMLMSLITATRLRGGCISIKLNDTYEEIRKQNFWLYGISGATTKIMILSLWWKLHMNSQASSACIIPPAQIIPLVVVVYDYSAALESRHNRNTNWIRTSSWDVEIIFDF